MNLAKSYDFFRPEMCRERLHIIGCGAVGSTVAENLARFGLTKISLYDFDIVEAHNIANQMFTQEDVGRSKVHALADALLRINPEIKPDIRLYNQGYSTQRLSGYVFLCVDNIDLRRQISSSLRGNGFVKAVFDFRMRLTDAQHYAADWSDPRMVDSFLQSMAFSHEEAQQSTPVSACNMTLSVVPTVRTLCALGVSNFINFVKDGKIRKLILMDAFSYQLDVF